MTSIVALFLAAATASAVSLADVPGVIGAGDEGGKGGAVPSAPAAAPAAAPNPRAVGGRAVDIEVRLGRGLGEYEAFGSGGDRVAGQNWRVQVGYPLKPFASVHLGMGRASFGCAGGFCARGPVTFTGSGVDAGLTLSWQGVWAQGGLVLQSLDAAWDGARGRETARAQSDPGLSAGAGVRVVLGPGLSITPGVRWIRHSAAFPSADAGQVVHVMTDVGIRYRLSLGR
jgi:hypothetical protein